MAEAKAFVKAIETGGPPPIPLDEIFEVTRICLELEEERKRRQKNQKQWDKFNE